MLIYISGNEVKAFNKNSDRLIYTITEGEPKYFHATNIHRKDGAKAIREKTCVIILFEDTRSQKCYEISIRHIVSFDNSDHRRIKI